MPIRSIVRGARSADYDTPPVADESPLQVDDADGLLKWLDADGNVKTAGNASGTSGRIGVGFYDPALIAATIPYLVPGRDLWIGAQSTDDSLFGANLVMMSGDGQSAPSIFSFQSGGTTSDPTAVSNGDAVFNFAPYCHDGTRFVLTGFFDLEVHGVVSTGIVPTRMRVVTVDEAGVFHTSFFTTDGGLTTPGTLVPSKGVLFPAVDPHVAGAWWDNAGTLTKSAG